MATLTTYAEKGDEIGVQRLLDTGTPVDGIENGRLNATPLQVAARAGHLEIVKRLLNAGANVNHLDDESGSPVTSAARERKWSVVKYLAEHGGDFRLPDGHGKSGRDYVKRCRGNRTRAAIEAVLERRGPLPRPTPDQVPSTNE